MPACETTDRDAVLCFLSRFCKSMDKPGKRVLCLRPENPLVDVPDILDGEERIRVRLLDVPGDPRDIVTVNKGDDHPDAAPCPFCIEAGGTVLFGLQKPRDLLARFIGGDDAHDHHADREPLFDHETHVRAQRKPECIREKVGDIAEVAHHAHDGEQPDDDFKERDDGSEVLDPLGEKDDPERFHADVCDLRKEDQRRQDDPGIDFRTDDKKRHTYASGHVIPRNARIPARSKEFYRRLYIKVIHNPAKMREKREDPGNLADECARFVIRAPSRVLCRIGIELLLAARAAEVVFLPLVLARELCRLLVDGHLTDRIDSHPFVTS